MYFCLCFETLGHFANVLFHQRALDSETRTTMSIARARTSVIFARKRDTRRHSTTTSSVNVVVAKTSYLMLEVLSFCDIFNRDISANFLVNQKYSEAFWSAYF